MFLKQGEFLLLSLNYIYTMFLNRGKFLLVSLPKSNLLYNAFGGLDHQCVADIDFVFLVQPQKYPINIVT